MKMMSVRLEGPTAKGPGLADDDVTELLWLHVAKESGIDHIHSRVAPGLVEIVFFYVTQDDRLNLHTALAICDRTIASTPALAGWRSHPGQLPPFT